jgi:Mg-chelatase subunit ChlD
MILWLLFTAVPAAAWAQTARPPAGRPQPQAAKAATAPGCTTAGRTLALVMDASGSMNAKLPSGETRIEVARRAVKSVAGLAPAGAQLSLRLYGAQSPAVAKNCEDTHLAVPSGPADAATIAASVDGAKAQGYTPIAHSLEQAQGDFPAGAKERVIVLVSDGKETCKGDPLLAARGLAAKGITIHTVGFVVDTAARMQLQNIAGATGGTYFDAPVGPELPDRLKAAFSACKQVVKLPPKPQPGKLRTTAGGMQNTVFNAETGERVDELSRVRTEITLPAGIYEVQFGPGRWKGIEVRSGETTTIEPGVLRLEHRVGGVTVVDSETGERFGSMDAANAEVVLMPGLYDLRYGKEAEWRFVKIDGGKTTVLDPARITIDSDLKWQKRARVVTGDGREVWRFDAVNRRAALPPDDYVIEIDDQKIPFAGTEGQLLEIKPQ